MKKYFAFFLIVVLIFAGCDSDDDDGGGPAATISGNVTGQDADIINYVGAFQTGGWENEVVDLDHDNAVPKVKVEVQDYQWSLTLPTNQEDWDLFQIVGWQDLNGDGNFDPESGEEEGWGYYGGDSTGIAALFYFTSETEDHYKGWNVSHLFSDYESIDDHLNDWFVK